MVNLAKLRKKAKEKKEKPHPEETTPSAEVSADSPLPTQHSALSTPEPPSTQHSAPSTERISEYLATAGQARAEARGEVVASEFDQLELLTFSIAGEQYAIDIESVVEIVTPRPVTRIPNADASVVGILSLRGTIVMLVDARRRLRHAAAETTGPDARIIVIQQDSESVGFLVDRVQRVVKVETAQIEPHPVVHSSEYDESVRGVFRHGDALTILLDLSKLLFTNSEWN